MGEQIPTQTLTPGKFITLEGGEGMGKSTSVQFIQHWLTQRNLSVTVTREPGGTQLAEKIRNVLLAHHDDEAISEQAELLLMFAARAQHITQRIAPALQQGQWVVCDRFTDATYAYQGGGRGMAMDAIAWLENFVQHSLRPDMTLLFDAPVEVGFERAKNRGALDRFENQQRAFFERVRKTYLQRATMFPERIKLIDATQSLPNVEQQIVQHLEALFP